jgi:hypothetical protein
MNSLKRALLFAAVVTGGCLYDSGDRCGPAMVYDTSLDACVCAPNAIVTGLGCTACADDEVIVAGKCGCASGYAKDASNVCEPVSGLGDACGSAGDCSNPQYGYCAPSTAGETAKTCTSTCGSDADCGAAYTCAVWEATPYCRQWSGLGQSCTGSADCAGDDASYCDTYQTHSCIVQGCSLSSDDCPRGTTCCDFSSYGLGTLCAEACQ